MSEITPGDSAASSLSSEVKNVWRHSAIYLLVPAISKAFGFFLFPVYTRFLSTGEFGVSSLIDIAITFAMMCMACSLSSAMTRFYYATTNPLQRRKIVSTVYLGGLVIGVPITIVLILLSQNIGYLLKISDEFLFLLRWAFVISWLSMISEFSLSYLRMRYFAKAFLAASVFQLVIVVSLNILFVVFWEWGVAGIVFAILGAQAVIGISLSVYILWLTRTLPDLRTLRQMVGYGVPLMPSAITQQSNNYIHPIMLQWLASGDPIVAVGIYSAGQKIGVVVNRFVVGPFNAFWNPRRLELVLQANNDAHRIIARMCTYATVVTISFALLVSVISESFFLLLNDIGFISDLAYLKAHEVIPLIALGYAIHSLEHHFATGMHASGKTSRATFVGVCSFCVMLGCNLILIPQIGYMGAACSAVIGISVRTYLFLMVSNQSMRIEFEHRRILFLIGSACCVYLACNWVQLHSSVWTLATKILLSSLFLPFLFVVRFFHPSETARFRDSVVEFLSKTSRPIRSGNKRTI